MPAGAGSRQQQQQEKTRGLRLVEALPALTATLRGELAARGRDDLAAQVGDLVVGAWCLCGDDFCQTFDTGARSQDGDPATVDVDVPEGMLFVHLDGGRVVEIEALYLPPLT